MSERGVIVNDGSNLKRKRKERAGKDSKVKKTNSGNKCKGETSLQSEEVSDSSSDGEYYSDELTDENKMAAESNEDFIVKLANALNDTRISTLLHGPTHVLLQKMDIKIESIDTKTTENKTEIEDLKTRIDEFEQRDRRTNMIVSGKLGLTEIDVDSMTNLINDKLELSLTDDDFNYVLQLGKKSKSENTRVRVVFKSEATKEAVIKKKGKLKEGEEQIWLSDDLTSYRNNLAYLARQAVKQNKLNQTWVSNSKVFVKVKADDSPKVLKSPKGIPK